MPPWTWAIGIEMFVRRAVNWRESNVYPYAIG